METVEAVVVGASQTADGAQAVELEALCPAAEFERASVAVGPWRVAVALDRPLHGGRCKVLVSLQAAPGRLQPGDLHQEGLHHIFLYAGRLPEDTLRVQVELKVMRLNDANRAGFFQGFARG